MMRSLTLAATWLALGVFGQDKFRENGYIIEYKSGASGLKARDSIASKGDIKVLKTFDSPYFSGASINTKDFNIDSLIAMDEVANVWRNNIYTLAPLKSDAEPTKEYALEMPVHNATGVAKLHDAGYLGEGALVGIVDTGTWYTHPALGGGIGPNYKVTGGYDLVGDQFWRPNDGYEKHPDSDPFDNQGHGTHVAGIVAGENDYWRGVAPKAKLRSYKVFSSADSPDSDDETVIEAFLMAVKDGCDIITCSIGNYNGWPQNAWAVVADRLTLDGIFVTISAGNEGAAGPFFGSTGAAGKNALAIASISNEKLPAKSWQAKYAPKDAPATTVQEAYLPSGGNFPTTVNGWPIKPMTFDTTAPADACDPYPAGTPRLDNVIPLVRRGTCAFVQKTQNLQALGAKYVLFYNNGGTLTTPAAAPGVTAAMLTAEVGEKIVSIVKGGGNVTGDFSADSEIPAYVDWPAGGKASDFTTWGALNDLSVKPDIGAPGGQIYSTYLNDGYAVLSGTSMACPYIAGVAALYVGKNGGRAKQPKTWARDLGRRIISSGQMIPWYDGANTDYNFTAPIEQVGTGLVDAYKVLNYDTHVDFASIGLNDTHHFSRYHDVTVKNNGKAKVDYTFSHAPAAGFETYECAAPDDCRIKPRVRLSPIKLEVDVNLPKSFSLGPGESKTVSVNFQNPEGKGWNANALPAYSGSIRVLGSNGDQLSVPYFGLAANLKEVVSPIYRKGFPVAVSTPGDVPIEEKANYTFDISADKLDFPRIIARLKWGSAQIRWDIFEENWTPRKWTWPLVPGKDGYIGTVHGIDKSTGQTDFPNVTLTFPVVWANRNADEADWQILHEYWWPEGKLGNGSKIAKGTYLMRFAALNPFGNVNNENNWSVFKTPKFTVV